MRKALIASLAPSRPPRSPLAATATAAARPRRPLPRRSPAAPRTSSASRGRHAHGRRPTTRPTRRGSAAPRRRSRGRSPTRTAARATSPPSRTRSRSSSASRRRRSSGRSCRSTTRSARARSRSTSTSPRSRTTPERAKAVDFSKRYYFVNQSVVGREGHADRVGELDRRAEEYKLGAQIGTTSYHVHQSTYIKPTSKPHVYDTNDAAVQALKNGQIDGLVVDLPTAFYVTAVQVETARSSASCRRWARRSGSAWCCRRAAR